MHRLLHEYVVVKAHVAVQYAHKAHHLRAVRPVVGRIARGGQRFRAVVHARAHGGARAGDEVVDHRHALRGQFEGAGGEQQVVVHQRRAVGNFDEYVLAQPHRGRLVHQVVVRQGVVVEEVLGHAGALRLPVQPQAARAVVDVVAAVDHVDGGVHLDAADLRAGQVLADVDVVDVVVLNDGKRAAQMADDAGLAAIVDVAAPHDVGADRLLRPAVQLRQADAFALRLCAVLVFPLQPLVVVFPGCRYLPRRCRCTWNGRSRNPR